MKKVMITLFLVALSVLFLQGYADAVVTGACSNCHTMHNSQGDSDMQFTGESDKTAKGQLLRGGCLGCHGQTPTGTDNIKDTTTPQVLHAGTTDLAGGNFGYITSNKAVDTTDSVVSAERDTAGHNVSDLSQAEGVLTGTPPGDAFSNTVTGLTLTCAGTLGCHGDRTVADKFTAIKGSHHADDAVLKAATINTDGQGGTTALSYRFLKGVKGLEDPDWQATFTAATDHNEYWGATAPGVDGSISVPAGNTISGLCAECHGNFHSAAEVGTGSPWERHPTDITLPSTTTKEYYTYTVYNQDAPVARTAITGISGTVTPGDGTAIVMCLSCHKAHATANADMLRWNYEDISAGTGSDTGRCFICHTSKDT